MALPNYLQGTQTGGLLQNLQQQQQSQMAPTQYQSGQGMPLYNAQSGIPAGFSQTTPYYGDDAPQGVYPEGTSPGEGGGLSIFDANGRIDYPRLQRMGYSPEQVNSMVDSGMTTIGQGEGWLSPGELGAKTDAQGTPIWDEFHGMNQQSGEGDAQGDSPAAATTAGGTSGGAGSNGLLSGSGGTGQQLGGPNVGSFPNFQSGTLAGTSGNIPGTVPGNVSGNLPGGTVPGQQPGGNVPMTQANPQNTLQQFRNTPGYMLTEGAGAVDQFQAGPGYQYAVDQAIRQVQGNAASRGLLDSGAAIRAMQDRAYNLANQEFGNWQQRQQQLYGDYQNRLAGLASGPTGADRAFQTGQGTAQLTTGTGQDVATLLANQGSSLFGGITGTGAAQAQNVIQAGNQQAQILGGNQATRLAAATAAQGGLF